MNRFLTQVELYLRVAHKELKRSGSPAPQLDSAACATIASFWSSLIRPCARNSPAANATVAIRYKNRAGIAMRSRYRLFVDSSFCTRLWQKLRLAINEVIHDDDILIGCFQDAIARGNSDQKNVSCVKPDSQERKASAVSRSGQYVPAKQQVTGNIEVFDLRAMVNIHVGEYGAEPFDRCRRCSCRYKEKVFRDVAIQGAEEPLGTERAKERGIDRVDISKSDRSVCWVDTVGANLESRSWSEE